LFDQPVKPVHRLGNPTPQQQSKGVWSYHLASGKPVNPMDERIESFLADVLALEGEDENAVRDGVRVAREPPERRSGQPFDEGLSGASRAILVNH
jgi:hypothetical protein